MTSASVDGGVNQGAPWPFWTQVGSPDSLGGLQDRLEWFMDRAVVLWADWGSSPPVEFEGADPVPCLLLSLCVSAWALGLLCGCICRRAGTQGGASVPAHPPPSPVDRWERISRRAVNFVRSRRRLSLAFAHLGTYSLRNAPESRPNLRRRAARRAATPGPVLHEGPAVRDGPYRRGAPGDHGPAGSLHLGRGHGRTGTRRA